MLSTFDDGIDEDMMQRFEKMLEDLYGGKDYVVTKDGELIEYDEDTQE